MSHFVKAYLRDVRPINDVSLRLRCFVQTRCIRVRKVACLADRVSDYISVLIHVHLAHLMQRIQDRDRFLRAMCEPSPRTDGHLDSNAATPIVVIDSSKCSMFD
jgi:hypothetical protein